MAVDEPTKQAGSQPSEDAEAMALDRALTLDGNAVAGLLEEVFGWEITAQPTQCANCGHVAECGALLAFVGGPGTVLRCSVCKEVVVRIVRTDRATYVDARGASFFRLPVSPDA